MQILLKKEILHEKQKIALLLLITIVFQSTIGVGVYAKDSTIEYSSEYRAEDGTHYKIEIEGDNLEYYNMVITNKDTNDKTVTNYTYGVLEEEEYSYKGKTWYGKKKYQCENRKVTDMTEYISEMENNAVKAQKYGKTETLIFYKYKASDGNKYSYNYAVGTSGADSGYTKIWCVKSYKVKNNDSNLIAYKNMVIDSNKDYAASGFSLGGASGALVAVTAVMATGVGAAIAIPILVTCYGLIGGSVMCLLDSYNKGEKARVYYDAAKLSAV